MKKLFNRKEVKIAAFGSLLFLMLYNIGLFKYLNHRPAGMHDWAQCDRACVARNYADKDFNFFLPRVNNISNETGITGMEFPFVNWVVACLYKMFGFHEIFYRLFMLSLYVISLFAAFEIALKFCNGDFVFSFIAVILYSLSPVLIFYSANFIPDTASLSLIIIAWWIFLTKDLEKRKFLILFTICCALASLIKITSLISVVAILILVLENRLRKLNEIKNEVKLTVALFISIVLTVSWYSYANYLNRKYNSGFFLLTMKPITSLSDFSLVYDKISNGMAKEYYAFGFQYFLLFINVFIGFFYKEANKLLLKITFLLYAGGSCFFLLMGNQFVAHDYYIITILLAVLFNSILFFSTLVKMIFDLRMKILVSLSVLIFANYLMIFCKKNYNNRFAKDNWSYNMLADRCFEMEPYLDSIGVKKNDAVIFYADPSPNIPLYLIGRRGITVPRENMDWIIDKAQNADFKYLIIDNKEYLTQSIIQPYIQHKVGEWLGISIFKIHD